jgi:hypothetical protein
MQFGLNEAALLLSLLAGGTLLASLLCIAGKP